MAVPYTETEGLRVLGAIRQSKTQKTKKGDKFLVKGVSIEEQRNSIGKWAAAYGHGPVTYTEDPSTSGKTSPWKRKGLGPYLTDPELIASWDVLVATKLDRLCRNTREFLALLEWAREHGKAVKILNLPDLDDSSPYGKAVLTILAAVAELERDMACERRANTLAELAEQGRWQGGAVSYGWRAVEYEGLEGWYLEPDEGDTAEVLLHMAGMSVAGKSNGQIAQWLNDHGHLNSAGLTWSVERVRLVLHSEYTAKLLAELDGEVDAGELRAALASRRPVNRGERVGGHQLLRIAFCAHDGRPFYYQKKKLTRKHAQDYYRCIQCHANVAASWLEAEVERQLLDLAGDRALTRRRLVKGDDKAAAIKALRADVEALEAISGTEAVVKAKEAEIEALKAARPQPDYFVLEPLGVTVAQHWDTLDHEGRGSFLRQWRVTCKADKTTVQLDLGDLNWPVGDFENATDLVMTMTEPVPLDALPPVEITAD